MKLSMSIRFSVSVLTLLLGLGSLACNPAVKDGLGPIIPLPDVIGSILRAGVPAADLSVEIRDELGNTLFGTRTDATGDYGLADVPSGVYEIKVSGKLESDFDSVSRPLILGEGPRPFRIDDLDIHAHGATAVAPVAGDELGRPSPHQPVLFGWEMPALAVNWARVDIYDESGAAFWSSDKLPVTETSWNGLGSEGVFRSRLAVGDSYSWRVKLELADGSEARLALRELRFAGPQHVVTTATGTVRRAGAEAAALGVDLRYPDGTVFLDTQTDELGGYTFGYMEPGAWDVKVSGALPGDFDSISYEFEVGGASDPIELPEMDVYAYGAQMLLPDDGGTFVKPGFFTPIEFTWTLPDTDVAWARVQFYGAADEIVWSSVKAVSEHVIWNGIANEGGQAGQPIPAGDYTWRIKLELGDLLAARLALRGIHFVD